MINKSLVIILITTGELVRHLLLEAHDLGMGNGEYTFFTMELVKSKSSYGDFSWYQPGDKRNKAAREMYESLMVVAVRVPTTQEFSAFVHQVSQLSVQQFSTVTSEADVSMRLIQSYLFTIVLNTQN